MKRRRRTHSAEFKARAALEALKCIKTINQIAQEEGVLAVQGRRSTEFLWHFCQRSQISDSYAAEVSMSLLAAGRVLIQLTRQQEFVLLGGWVVYQLFEDQLEVGEGIGSVAADLLYEGVDDGNPPAGFLAADEHPVLVTEFGGT